MKKYYIPIITLLFALIISFPAPAAAEKIGFVDVRDVLSRSNAGKKAQTEFKKTFEKKKAAIQSRDSELKKQTDAFQKQRPGMTEIAAKEKELELQKKYREFQRMVSSAEDEMRRKDQGTLQEAYSRDLQSHPCHQRERGLLPDTGHQQPPW